MKTVITCLVALFTLSCGPRESSGIGAELDGRRYLSAVQRFADTVLENGRDSYGAERTPLFADGLHAETLEPAIWMNSGEKWVLSNFASQQALMRLLDGLTTATGDPKYREAAEAAAGYALEHLRTPNGLLNWGGHAAWDLTEERVVGQGSRPHELKQHQPYYALLWRVDEAAARKLMEAVWAGHILDWSRLDYNRHAAGDKMVTPQWDHEFDEEIEVPFPSIGNNLSFANVTPPLLHTGTMLAALGHDAEALKWTRRLVWRWQQGRDPETGLCGGQLSYREHDRAEDALGHVHPGINEAKIVATYHQTSRYHALPLAQMQAAEQLIATGGESAAVGREFVEWASEDLKTYAEHSYDSETGEFVAMTTDGTPLNWKAAKTGYYNAESFAPRKAPGLLLWSYAMAYRLTGGAEHWRMAREMARHLELGDIGQPDGERALDLETAHGDLRSLYGLLELYRATEDRALLALAARVGDNLAATQAKSGLFPAAGRDYARTGDELPLALLHLAAAIGGSGAKLPPPMLDAQMFHCVYDGELEEHQKKRADERTMDSLVYYGYR